MGRIYLDMGDILSIQMNYNSAYKKYQEAISEFKQINNQFYFNRSLI